MRNNDMIKKIQSLFTMARKTHGYEALCKEFSAREKKFEELVSRLTEEEQDIIWGYVCLSEDMNWYLLEMICDKYDIDPGIEKRH